MATLQDPTTGDIHTVDDTLAGYYANQGWQPYVAEEETAEETATELEGAEEAPEEAAPPKGGRRRAAAESTTTPEEQ